MKRCATPVLFAGLFSSTFLFAQVAVVTGQYDTNRTGANLNETVLTPANVNASQFGLIYTWPVDANVFAEPLYVPGVSINGVAHNVVYVATMNDSVYAFDADSGAGSPLWKTSLGTPIVQNLAPGMPVCGILATPVIDLATSTLYVVTETSESNLPVYRLHALNLASGTESTPSSVIQAWLPGTGDNSVRRACGPSGTVQQCIPFVAAEQRQRPALLEANGTIYIGFGTRSAAENLVPYHGWLFAYSASTLQQTGVFLSTPNTYASSGQPACSSTVNPCGHAGGIWMSGRGPAADSNGVYAVTGNGGFGSGNYGESILRLDAFAQVLDYFTPSGFLNLNYNDLDLGDSGAILMPKANFLLTTGKTGLVYVVNRTNLGKLVSGDPQTVQAFQASPACGSSVPTESGCYEIHSPVYWARSNSNPVLFTWGWADTLRAFDFAGSQFVPDVNPANSLAAPNYPGGELSLSANGDANGILWAIVPQTQSTPATGSLYAFNAANIAQTLWTTVGIPADGNWLQAVFATPVVANGKVYVPTSSNQVRVYGLCSTATPCYPPAAAN